MRSSIACLAPRATSKQQRIPEPRPSRCVLSGMGRSRKAIVMLKTSLVTAVAALALAGCAGGTGATGTQTAMSTSESARHTVGVPSRAPPRREATPAPEAAPPTTAPTAEATPAPQPATPATPAAPATYTDAQLRSFATASRDIQPLQGQLTSGTPEQQAVATTQVRAILQRNNLDGATYNAIATQAHADPAFAARIAALSSSSSPG